MAKTIKVIDLLNKIANGEEVPEKVKYCGAEYSYLDHRKDYKNMKLDFDSCIIDSKYHNLDWLNDTVEILEEQQDIDIQNIEEIKFSEGDKEHLGFGVDLAHTKINALVQAVKQLDRNIKDKE